MIQSFVHTSENGNSYIYDHQFRLSMLVHPEFENVYEKSVENDPYYLGKYKYLKKHGFFSKPKPVNYGTLNELVVKDNIAQTPQIVFEVTDLCNLKCSYCAYGELYEGYDVRNQKSINTNNAISILKYIFDLKPRNKENKFLIGFYGGEPLVNGNFIKQIIGVANQLKSEKEMNIEYNMTTNATLLHKYINLLVENKFTLLISLDGNEKNHSYRVFSKNKKNSFQKVIKNIDMIQRDYPEYFDRYVNFSAVLHDQNSVKDIYEFIYTRYHKISRISELTPDDINPDKKELYNKMFQSKSESEAEYQKEGSKLLPHNALSTFSELINFLKFCSINFYVSNIHSLLHDVENKFPVSACLPGQRKILFTTRNKLLPCEKINYKFSAGEVNGNAIINIPEITQRYNQYFDQMKSFCQDCYANRFCGICLFQMNNFDKLGTEEFVCEGFCDLEKYKNKLHRIFSFLEKSPNDLTYIIENVILE